MQKYHLLFRLIVVGDSGVGKSCFVQQFLDGTIRQHHDVTVGVQFGNKSIKIQNKHIKLQVWDTAGQQNFRSITRSYYRGAIGAFLIYDVSRRITFQHIRMWLQQIKTNGNPYIYFFLIGNKSDLVGDRMVSREEGEELAREYEMVFMETNYREQKRINQCFEQMSQRILKEVESGKVPLNLENIGIKMGDGYEKIAIGKVRKSKEGKKCC